MRYMAGIAFVVSIFQGNFELAIFIGGCFVVIFFVVSAYSSVSDKSKLSKFTREQLDIRIGWRALRFKDEHSGSVGDLIYSQDSRDVVLIRKIATNAEYSMTDAGRLLGVEVVELLPKETMQPSANVKFRFSDHYDVTLCISGEVCWEQMRADLHLIEL